jgi:archaellum component FlaC
MGVAELTAKLESLSQEDYDMVVMLVERLSSKPSDVLRKAREKYLSKNPMSMEEIDEEIELYRRERRG